VVDDDPPSPDDVRHRSGAREIATARRLLPFLPTPNLRRAKSDLAKVIRKMIQVKQTLSSRKAKRTMPASRRDALLAATGGLHTDLGTLRSALRCPDDALR